ncbi:MAG: sulfite exporter TauE/SafE family protein [Rhodobacteraceae bacterium]|nr:sulfite exporter TauE/SafE family protein [Paracoccaceae bacterium]
MLNAAAAGSELLGLAGIEDLILLMAGSLLAGIVRGFTGFGSAMVFLPFAGAVMPPIWAITVLAVLDIAGPVLLAPRTARDCDWRDLVRLAAGAVVGLPLGIMVLRMLPPDLFRYSVSVLSIVLVIFLAAGIRFKGVMNRSMIFGTGGLGGFLAGSVGLPGPPVMLLYLASQLPAKAIRANLFLYLILADFMILAAFALQNILFLKPVLIGMVAASSCLFGVMIGAALFDAERERRYRIVAYLIITATAVGGLPLFGKLEWTGFAG